jgi:NTE family protein
MATAPDPSPPAQRVGPVAFVLSGGGNLGALQIGMLRALLEHDVRPDLVVGCSVGAINGAGFADAPTLEGLDGLERMWLELDKHNLMPTGWSNAVALGRRGEAIHDQSGLRRMADESLHATTFEQLQVHFECVATDVAGVREVWFDAGPLVEPILASSALPAIYPAVEIDGVRYLDGGIVNDVPMSRAVELGARTIYILQVGSFMRSRRDPRRPLDVAVQAYWIARHHRFKRELGALPPDVDVHVLPTGETPRMRFNDFTHSATLIARAHEATAAYLADLTAGRRPSSPVDALPAAVTAPLPPLPSDEAGPSDPDALGASEASLPSPSAAGSPALARTGGNGRSGNGHRHRLARTRTPENGNGNGSHARPAPATDAGGDGTGAAGNGDGTGAAGDGAGDDAVRLAGVRRWARATRLRRLTDLPLRRPPATAGRRSETD